MKIIARTLLPLMERVFSKRYGPEFAKIFVNWSAMVGEGLAQVCVPIMINKIDKILVVHIYDQAKSVELYFMQEIILQRINLLLESKNFATKLSKIHVKNVILDEK